MKNKSRMNIYSIFPRYPKWYSQAIFCQKFPEIAVVSLYSLASKGFSIHECLQCPLNLLWLLVTLF